jgi:hypothetical protein
MPTLIIATAVAAVAVGLWLFSSKQAQDMPTASLAPSSISYWDAHNQAHLDRVPVQHFEDSAVASTERGNKPTLPALLVGETRQRQ